MRKPRTGRRKSTETKPQTLPDPVIEGADAQCEVGTPAVLPEGKSTGKTLFKNTVKSDPFLDEIYTKKSIDANLNHRSYVGPADRFDEIGMHQFKVMTKSGLKVTDSLLDLGCGAMRGGKFLLKYLDAKGYYGIEPNKALLKKGLFAEVTEQLAKEKKPNFKFNDNFNLAIFEKEFDFILAQSIFSHAAPEQIMDCLKSAYDSLASGGKFVFNYVKGASDYTGTTWVYPNAARYTELRMFEYVRKAGFSIEENDFKHPNGLTWIVAKKQ